MYQIQIDFTQPGYKNAIHYHDAKQLVEISKLKDELQKKIESARFLSCGRKGAWGQRTMADEKRDIAINKLKGKISAAEYKLTKHSGR